MTITPEQSKAARSLLGWNQKTLAQEASVGLSTIADFEGKKRIPIKNNLEAIRIAFEKHYIEFIEDTGVNLRNTDAHKKNV